MKNVEQTDRLFESKDFFFIKGGYWFGEGKFWSPENFDRREKKT